MFEGKAVWKANKTIFICEFSQFKLYIFIYFLAEVSPVFGQNEQVCYGCEKET